MKKHKLLTTPTKLDVVELTDFEYNVAPMREEKAARLRLRQMRKLRRQLI